MVTIKDYFLENKELLSQEDKFDIYQDFLEKKYKSEFLSKKHFFVLKNTFYSLFLFFVIVGIFNIYSLDVSKNWIFVDWQQQKQQVHADYIANIINFKWQFDVEHDWKKITTLSIQNNDIIYLPNVNSNLTFNLSDDTQAKIIWPAKIKLKKIEKDQYELFLYYWNFVKIQSLWNISNKLKLVADNLIIAQKNKWKYDFKYIKKWKKNYIENNWTTLFVINWNKFKTDVKKKQLLTVEWNSINLKTEEEFKKAVKSRQISQNFSISKKNINNNIKLNKDKVFYVLNNTWISSSIDTWIADDLSNLIWKQDKVVLSPKNTNRLLWYLYKTFLKSNINDLFKNKLTRNIYWYNIAYNNLELKVSAMYKILNQNYTNSKWNKQVLIDNISYIKKYIQKNIVVPEKYINNLSKVSNFLKKLDLYDDSFSGSVDIERNNFYTWKNIFE